MTKKRQPTMTFPFQNPLESSVPRECDLHSHSLRSDGTMTPSELVLEAKKQKLKVLAITDHDSIDGVAEAMEAGKDVGVTVVSGIEISCKFPREDCHLVGLFLDSQNEELKELLRHEIEGRDLRNKRMVEKLKQVHNFDITFEEVAAVASGVVGRPHIAEVLVKKGYAENFRQVFNRFIGDTGDCFVSRLEFLPEPSEAIKVIHKAGGVAVLAHPQLLHMERDDLDVFVGKLKSYGLDGIEVTQNSMTKEDSLIAMNLAVKYGLHPSGGSDFHGSRIPDIVLGRGRSGDVRVPFSFYETLLDASKHYK